jgi:hypothetical protein
MMQSRVVDRPIRPPVFRRWGVGGFPKRYREYKLELDLVTQSWRRPYAIRASARLLPAESAGARARVRPRESQGRRRGGQRPIQRKADGSPGPCCRVRDGAGLIGTTGVLDGTSGDVKVPTAQ